MISLESLKAYNPFKPEEQSSFVGSFLSETSKIDWEVFLPTRGRNLQREFVWSLEQKRELIWSVLIGRHIPHCAMINTYDEVWQIIDGKQRLSSLFGFVNNEFTIVLDNVEYYYKDLPEDFQRHIIKFPFRYYVVNEGQTHIPDGDKIAWFKYINFAGTPQDKNHLDNL